DGDYKLALVEFERSYELVPNFRVLYNIGEVEYQLNNYARAFRTLKSYLEQGGDRVPANRRTAVEKDIESLRIRTARLGVTVNVEGADVLVDGERIGRTPLAERELIDAGNHRVTVRKAGYVEATEPVTLVGGDEKTIALTLAATPAPMEPAPPSRQVIEVHHEAAPGLGPVWIGWGLTSALAVG